MEQRTVTVNASINKRHERLLIKLNIGNNVWKRSFTVLSFVFFSYCEIFSKTSFLLCFSPKKITWINIKEWAKKSHITYIHSLLSFRLFNDQTSFFSYTFFWETYYRNTEKFKKTPAVRRQLLYYTLYCTP